MQTYYKLPTRRLTPPEEYYVAVAYRRIEGRNYVPGAPLPVLVDPTRRMPVQRPLICERSELEMHHMSYIRLDMRAKLESSSANVNFKDRVDQLVDWYNTWTPGKRALLAGVGERYYDLEECTDLFELNRLEWIN